MKMTASFSASDAVPASEVFQNMLAAGRLPDAPMAMPTQVLERSTPRLAFVKALFAGPLRSAGT
jgi:hypothetical protein